MWGPLRVLLAEWVRASALEWRFGDEVPMLRFQARFCRIIIDVADRAVNLGRRVQEDLP